MSYSVELRIDTISGHSDDLMSYLIPHAFFVVTDASGNESSFGFAPQETGLTGPGDVSDNYEHPANNSSGKIPITEEQYNDLINYVNRTDANPHEYNLPLGAQCAVWAMNGLQEAGIIDLSIMPPDYEAVDKDPILGILQTLVYNPYTINKTLNLYNFWGAITNLTSTIVLNIKDLVNDFFNLAQNWLAPVIRVRDPLVLDLDGDGIETLGITATTQVLYDFDGDGVKTGTGWISGDDGFVVLDRNGNGTIDNGGELFGDQTLVNGVKATDGFAALRGEDSNSDGKFDSSDANFANVRIWQDVNADGISQADELHALSELGILSINLTATQTNTTTNGNLQTHSGTYTKANGDTGESGTLEFTEAGAAGNLNFSQNTFYREFTDHLILTDTALALPDMQGSGLVRMNNFNFKNTRSVA